MSGLSALLISMVKLPIYLMGFAALGSATGFGFAMTKCAIFEGKHCGIENVGYVGFGAIGGAAYGGVKGASDIRNAIKNLDN